MTVQIPDRMILNGKDYPIYSLMIPDEFEHPRILNVPSDMLHYLDPEAQLTSCSRAYYAEWRASDSQLYLTGVRGRYRLLGDAPLHALWFSGEARVFTGRRIAGMKGLCDEPVFDEEVWLTIESGLIIETQTINR